jgi:hypothetical protein
MVQSWLNEALREVTGRRMWYGNLTRGQIVTSGMYSTGSVQCTLGSKSIQGIGTNWTQSIGNTPITQMSLRVGYYAPIYNVVNLDQTAQVITIDLPWGNASVSSTGYFLIQQYFSIPNLKFFFSVRNLQLYYRLSTNYNQSFIDNVDPTRLILLYPRLVATMPPDPNGNYCFELWPSANTPQALPWTGFIQYPILVNDTDNFPAFIRSDALVSYAAEQALMYRPKDNPNYSEATALNLAERKRKEFEMRINTAAQEDESLWRGDIIMREEMNVPVMGPDGTFITGGDTYRAMSVWGGGDY